MRCALFLFGTWLILPTLVSGQTLKTPVPSPKVVLEDQFERATDLTATRGNVVVLVYGDKASADMNRILGTVLHVHYHPKARGLAPDQAQRAPMKPIPNWPAGVKMPDVRVIPVACIGSVPGLVAKFIRSQFKSRSPVVPVFLDFSDTMKQSFGLAPGISNVVVLDINGKVRCRASARYTREQIIYVTKLIDELRLEAKATANKTSQK